ncbi:Protein PBDC1 [Holothuria leucospilota]|uniref:Protein PBDC1 n=1 Tax=Holothuria leucospilota TaxID=206669 RepID=A0A9Q1BI63_HOLLE|nr:Protein PBDC1 [Holothuria leucospilota]
MEISKKAEEYSNDQGVEQIWAFKAFHHAETYMNLISSLDSRLLKLTKNDDDIYKKFQEDFPDMSVDIVKEDQLKSPAAKEKWRPFCNHFKENVDDFNYGTLLRLDCNKDYSEENSILVTRIQFFAIEIARNRQGFNLCMWKTKRKTKNEEEGETRKEEQKTDEEKPIDGDCDGR